MLFLILQVCNGIKMHTPNLDKLASRGLTFKHHYNQYAVWSVFFFDFFLMRLYPVSPSSRVRPCQPPSPTPRPSGAPPCENHGGGTFKHRCNQFPVMPSSQSLSPRPTNQLNPTQPNPYP